MSWLPAVTGFGDSVLVIETSAEVCTVVFTDAELLLLSGSKVVEDADAVLVSMVPSGVFAFTVAWIRTMTEFSAVMVPNAKGLDQLGPVAGLHPEPMQYFAPDSWEGRESVRDTLCASDGPPLWTVI